MVKDREEMAQNQRISDPSKSTDELIKLAVLKSFEPKPPQKDNSYWFGVPKGLLVSGLGALILALTNWFLSIQTEATKLSNDLIKLAVTAEDQDQAAKNLRFLARLDLIAVEEEQLDAVLKDENSKPLFSSSGSGPDYRIGDNGFVDLDDDWVRKNIVSVFIPQLKGVKMLMSDAVSDGTIRLNREAIPAAIAAFSEIEAMGLKERILSYDGSFVPRAIRGSTRLSIHATGKAFDINCRWNVYGKPAADIGQPGSIKELIPIFEKHSFVWGGSFKRSDACHFEFRTNGDASNRE